VTRARTAAIAAAAALLALAACWFTGSVAPRSDLAGLTASPRAMRASQKTSVQAFATPAGNFLNAGLRHRLDALWLEAGDARTPAELKQRLAAVLARHFAPQDLPRAAQLLDRYVDYRVALGELKPPANASDPRALGDALAARQKLRRQWFAPDEYDALFAREDALDVFTIARLEIMRDGGLTASQKQERLRSAELGLGDTEVAARAAFVQHEAVAAQNASFEANGATDAQRYAQRSASFGDAAAQRLAQLDADERDWQARLSRYAQARSAQTPPPQLQALAQQLFSPEERLRLEAALTLRASSGR
jgi:lipase chaperone LimK